MAEVQCRRGKPGLGQNFIPGLATGQIALGPGTAVKVDNQGKRSWAHGPKQAQRQWFGTMFQIVHVIPGVGHGFAHHSPSSGYIRQLEQVF